MPQQPAMTFFLHVYDVGSGLWVHTTLGSGVSPPIQEAMNLILRKDGILAFIGTRSEFGLYLSELKNTHGKDYRHCWISLPASTITSMLGLCLNMPMSGRPELVFYGSPLTILVALLLTTPEHLQRNLLESIESAIRRTGLFIMEDSMTTQIRVNPERSVTLTDLEEALSYISEKPLEVHECKGVETTSLPLHA